MSGTVSPFRPHDLGAQAELIPAKIWELLRRNPAFRKTTARLRELDTRAREQTFKGQSKDRTACDQAAALIEPFEESHPFAFVALQWLVPDPLFVKIRAKAGKTQSWYSEHPLRPQKSWQLNKGHRGTPMRRGPFVEHFQGDNLNPFREWGRWQPESGLPSLKFWFDCNTAWPDLPAGLRSRFQYIWHQRFDSRPRNSLTKDQSDSPRPQELTEDFQNWSSLSTNAKAVYGPMLADDYRVFAIPRAILTKGTADELGNWLARHLKKGSSLHDGLVKKALLNDTDLFGTKTEWSDWHQRQSPRSRGVRRDTHFYRRCKYIDWLISTIFPSFNLATLLANPPHRASGKKHVRK